MIWSLIRGSIDVQESRSERVHSGEIEVEKEDSYRVAITPTAKARAILEYMKSLRNDKPLPEAPLVRRKQASAE